MSFHYTVETTKSVAEAAQALEQNLKEINFGVLWDFNITETLHSKGFDRIQSTFRVLEVCNPKEAEGVLSQNPLVSYFLPCKIVVYEQDGKTKMGIPKPTALIGNLGDDKLQPTAEKIEAQLIEVLNKSK